MDVDRVLVEVQSVRDAIPIPPAVETTQEAADFDPGVDFTVVRRIDRDTEHALGHGLGPHANLWKGDLDRELLPSRSIVVARTDGTGLVAREERFVIARMVRQRPDRQ